MASLLFHHLRVLTYFLLSRTYEDAEGNTKEIYVPKAVEDAEDLFKIRIESGINFSKYAEIPVKVTGDNQPKPIASFAASTLNPVLLRNIEKSGYKVPTPVQKYAIPIIREKVS